MEKIHSKATEPTSALIDNKIASTNIKVSKNLRPNNSEKVTNEHEKEIPKKNTHISSRE